MIQTYIERVIVQGFIIIRDAETITARIQDLAPKFLWEVESHMLENIEKKPETVLICRKKFWAIVWNAPTELCHYKFYSDYVDCLYHDTMILIDT